MTTSTVSARIHQSDDSRDGYNGCPILTWTGAYPTALVAELGLELDSIDAVGDDGSYESPHDQALILGVNLENGDAERLVERINALQVQL